MKNRDLGRKWLLFVFAFAICLIWLLWIGFLRVVPQTSQENRELAPRPSVSLSAYPTFSKEFTAYFDDRIPFRHYLIAVHNMLDLFLGHSSNENVILGKEHWLFFKGEEENALDNYIGNDLFTQEELEAIAAKCVQQRDYLREQGKEYVIFIAPNKERIYSEYMPDQYGAPADQYGARQIYEYLKEHTDVTIIYPEAELKEAKTKLGEPVYYSTDTHWNTVGAYIGSRLVLEQYGILLPAVDSGDIHIARSYEKWGDLAGMLNLQRIYKRWDNEYEVSGYPTNHYEVVDWNPGEASRLRSQGGDARKLYVVGDSFSTNMCPYLGSQFDETYIRRIWTYSYDDFLSEDPDVVLFEIVERYAFMLQWFDFQADHIG